ncbi:hypothetical protein [Leptolyngbya ohadii]|uniref:hypothetical protein n=1 Tax=Leptolyngbya ohadii TaxID=1962290 RepID=UPI000B599C2B|nr:hypothetical protein [Leptolyngbya ohadii]
MFADPLPKVDRVEVAITALGQALKKLHEHDYISAQITVAQARQILEELQLDFDLHFQAEELLEQLFQFH